MTSGTVQFTTNATVAVVWEVFDYDYLSIYDSLWGGLSYTLSN